MKTGKLENKLRDYSSFYIDSMCFIYLLEKNKEYGRLTKYIFSYLEKKGLKSATSTIAISEILTGEKLQKNRVAYSRVKNKLYTMPGLQISLVDDSVAEAAAHLRFNYNLRLIDSLHLATALQNKMEAMITNDEHFKKAKEAIDLILLDTFL